MLLLICTIIYTHLVYKWDSELVYKWDSEVLSFLYLDLYVPGDDTPISKGSFMRTKQLCVVIHIRINGVVDTVKPV